MVQTADIILTPKSPELQALLDQSHSGIQKIYQDYFSRIEVFVKKSGGDQDIAKDLFQDALMVIYQKAKDDRFSLNCSFYTFLYAVVRNLWRDQLKKKHRSEVTLDESVQSIDEHAIDESIHYKRRYAFYQEKFLALSEDCQSILKMFFDKTSMKEMAEKMNTTEGYMRKKKHGCKKKLMNLMESDPLFQELKL